MYDVAVVGGGPAGATAARELATAGAAVVVLEKRELPRYKTCGGGIVARARRWLGVDIAGVVEREFHAATMSLQESGVSFAASRSVPIISMTMRAPLDALLLSTAEKAGADVRPRTELRALTQRDDGVELTTTDGTIAARFVIGADGALSPVARLGGWTRDTRRLVPAIEAEVYVGDRQFAAFGDRVRFDFDVPPHGYAWLFPKRNHLSIGVGNLGTARDSTLNAAFARYRARLGLDRVVREERHGFVIPITPRRDGVARRRVLLVGDAAGFADPVTAEGISFAIRSAQLAAQALLTARLDVDRVAPDYQRLVRRTIAPELAAGRVLARILYASPRLRTWTFRRYGERLANAVTDVFTGAGTYTQALASPANYVKLLTARRLDTSARAT